MATVRTRKVMEFVAVNATDLEHDHGPKNAGDEDWSPADRLARQDVCT